VSTNGISAMVSRPRLMQSVPCLCDMHAGASCGLIRQRTLAGESLHSTSWISQNIGISSLILVLDGALDRGIELMRCGSRRMTLAWPPQGIRKSTENAQDHNMGAVSHLEGAPWLELAHG
jgi:hypothetical protein